MKAKHLIVGALLLAALPQAMTSEANNALLETKQKVKQEASINAVTGQEYFSKACDAYCNAQISIVETETSKFYASAISNISKAVALEPANSDYFLLGSQIWRGKGGISYAKRYFNNAEIVMLQRLEQNPNDIASNIDYAIACYAGDIRFQGNYSVYKKRAKEYAERTIELCEASLTEKENSNVVRVMALANLILQNSKECQELLLQAKKIDIDRSNCSFFKLFFDDETVEHKTANVFYSDLFENTVAKEQWLWGTNKENVDKEFLLYYMTDEARNNDL